MASIGTIEANAGTVATGVLKIGDDRTGAPICLPVAILEGLNDGPTLYLQAASDGDELNGVGVIREVVPKLDPTALSGTILITGIVNLPAYQLAEHRNPIDNKKLNRTYPGNSEGTLSERIAAATYDIATEADYILDLHQGSTSRMIDEVRVRCGRHHSLHGECLELARVFGTGFIYDQKGPRGQLARAAPGDGIPSIDPELGGAIGWDEKSITIGVRGIMNVLKYYGFLEEEHHPYEQTRATHFDQYVAPMGGLISLSKSLGDPVTQGDALFEITSVFGERHSITYADNDGILWRSRRLPQAATGEYVCSVGTHIDSV